MPEGRDFFLFADRGVLSFLPFLFADRGLLSFLGERK